ncbi:MAG: hypothetical protein GKR77_06025 [Legionellales bacterium]|nr:hypothetical protein [Legionellales bacterium]
MPLSWMIHIHACHFNFILARNMLQQGFGLWTLLLACALLAALTGIAIPSYTQYITKTHRAASQLALMDLAVRLEHYHIQHRTYASATIASGNPATDVLPRATIDTRRYRLHLAQQTDTYFELHAIPLALQAKQDKMCQTLTLTSRGKRHITQGPSGQPTGTPQQCWQ